MKVFCLNHLKASIERPLSAIDSRCVILGVVIASLLAGCHAKLMSLEGYACNQAQQCIDGYICVHGRCLSGPRTTINPAESSTNVDSPISSPVTTSPTQSSLDCKGTYEHDTYTVDGGLHCDATPHTGSESRIRHASASVPFDQTSTRQNQRRTYNNGTWGLLDGTSEELGCVVEQPPASPTRSVVYVDVTVSDGDGVGWSTAFANLQQAIDDLSSGFLDGFTITGKNADANQGQNGRGGGMYNVKSNPPSHTVYSQTTRPRSVLG
jgi:hypothetical protein